MGAETLTLRVPGLEAMVQSLTDFTSMAPSGAEALEQSGKTVTEAARLFFDRIVCGENIADFLLGKPAGKAALVAGKIERFQLNPCNGYVELFTAFAAAHGNACIVISHGWPILSLVSGNTSMTEGGAESMPAPGGL